MHYIDIYGMAWNIYTEYKDDIWNIKILDGSTTQVTLQSRLQRFHIDAVSQLNSHERPYSKLVWDAKERPQ